MAIPFCIAIGGIIDAQNSTSVVLPASRPTEVLLDVDAEVLAGCCVEGTVKVAVNFVAGPTTGFVTVSLESPDLQSTPLGNATDSFSFESDIFQGAVPLGVWKLKLLASSDAAGWVFTFGRFQMELGQCV